MNEELKDKVTEDPILYNIYRTVRHAAQCGDSIVEITIPVIYLSPDQFNLFYGILNYYGYRIVKTEVKTDFAIYNVKKIDSSVKGSSLKEVKSGERKKEVFSVIKTWFWDVLFTLIALSVLAHSIYYFITVR